MKSRTRGTGVTPRFGILSRSEEIRKLDAAREPRREADLGLYPRENRCYLQRDGAIAKKSGERVPRV